MPDGHNQDIFRALTSHYQELRVVERRNIIELKSAVPFVSALRNVTETDGSATISVSGGEYALSTTANGSDRALMESAERGRYIPGYSAQAGIGVRIPTLPAGDCVMNWGIYDDSDGAFFGADSGGVFVEVRRNGVQQAKVYQEDWNRNTMSKTGENPHGIVLDMSKGNIFQITFSWYGYGTVDFEVVTADADNRQVTIPVHHHVDRSGQNTFQEPNLPLHAEVDNNGEATAYDLFVGGRQFSVVGTYNPHRRITSEYRLEQGSIAGTFVPLIGMRRKASNRGVSIKISSFDVATDTDLILMITQNATGLTGQSYQTPSNHEATETAIESDVSATAITPGLILWQGVIKASGPAGKSGFAGRDILLQDFIREENIYMAARTVGGTTATVTTAMRVVEEW